MLSQPEQEHRWLARLVGSWEFSGEFIMGPDQPPMQSSGTETVRLLGDLWVLCEGASTAPDNSACATLMTLGYNPATKKFVGTFIATGMAHLWHYVGTLDETQKKLTLETTGPSMTSEGQMVPYRDVIEWINDDERILSSQLQLPDGSWQHFMMCRYRRKK